MEYFFDSYAVIELLKNSRNYERFSEFQIFINTLNLTEIYYSLLTETDEKTADLTTKKIKFQFIEITPEIAIEASKFRFSNRKSNFSYADCLGYICAKNNKLKFLTGDEGFRNFDNVEFVK